MRRRSVLALVAGLSVLAAGCASAILVGGAAAGGARALMWHRGWLRQTIDEPLERVHRAARVALDDLDIVIKDEACQADRGVLDGYTRDTRRAVVRTLRLGEQSTQVRIHVGLRGDQQESIRILQQLRKRL